MSNFNFRTVQELKTLLKTDHSNAYDRINLLFDAGTFVETGAYVKRATTEFDCADAASEFEGVVTGYGAIDGRLVFAFLQDFSRMKGAIGKAGAEKICRLYDLAMQNGAPVIALFESAGAKTLEGMEALAGYGMVMRKVADASGIIPQIAVITGICGGTSASIAGMFDFVIGAKENGQFYVNPPSAMKAKATEKAFSFGSVTAAAENGSITAVCDNADAAIASVRKLLTFLPSNNAEGTVYAMDGELADTSAQITELLADKSYDMKALLSALSAQQAFYETYADYGKEIVTALAQIGRTVVGVVASQPSVHGGAISLAAALKAARMIRFCDCFRIPLLTLVDSEGIAACPTCEAAGLATALAKLGSAYAASKMPKVTVILGNAIGQAYTLLGSKSIGADLVFALDCAKISIFSTDAGVEFLYGDRIRKAKDSAAEKDAATAEFCDRYASALVAARSGEVDDLIDSTEIGAKIAAAFEMLSCKSETLLTKRHSNLPL